MLTADSVKSTIIDVINLIEQHTCVIFQETWQTNEDQNTSLHFIRFTSSDKRCGLMGTCSSP